MSLVTGHLHRLGRASRSRLMLLLVGVAMENLVFRREIRMDAFGRLRRGSPLYWVHGLMAAVLLLIVLVYFVGGWRAMLSASALILALLVFGTHPYAASRAFASLSRERETGSLDQLYLTSLGSKEIFDGKFFGLLAPLIEVRRYVMILGFFVCLGIWRLIPGPWFLLALFVWLTGMNQIGHSLFYGTLAGLKWGLIGEAGSGQILRDWRLNAWSYPIWLHVKIGAALSLPLAFLFWLGSHNTWPLYSAFGLMLVIPFYVSLHLSNRQRADYERLKYSVRLLTNLEGIANASSA